MSDGESTSRDHMVREFSDKLADNYERTLSARKLG